MDLEHPAYTWLLAGLGWNLAGLNWNLASQCSLHTYGNCIWLMWLKVFLNQAFLFHVPVFKWLKVYLICKMFWNHGCTTFYFCLFCLYKDQRKHLVLFSHPSPGARKTINLICHISSQISGGTQPHQLVPTTKRPYVFNIYTFKLFQSA